MPEPLIGRPSRPAPHGHLLAALLLLTAGLVGHVQSVRAETLKVMVSIPPQAWLVERIGGERVEVQSLLAPGDSPATFQPSDSQVTALLRSDLFLRIGVPFERGRWFQAIESMGRVAVVDARGDIELRPLSAWTETAPRDAGFAGVPGHDSLDPHVWLSPRLLARQAATVAEAMAERDRRSRHRYHEAASRLIDEINALDGEIATQLSAYRGRAFMVFHPSWGYFAHDYGLRQLPIELEGKTPSDEELTRIQRLARQYGISVVFSQPQFHHRVAHAVADTIGARVVEIDPLTPDVVANLLDVTKSLVASFESGST